MKTNAISSPSASADILLALSPEGSSPILWRKRWRNLGYLGPLLSPSELSGAIFDGEAVPEIYLGHVHFIKPPAVSIWDALPITVASFNSQHGTLFTKFSSEGASSSSVSSPLMGPFMRFATRHEFIALQETGPEHATRFQEALGKGYGLSQVGDNPIFYRVDYWRLVSAQIMPVGLHNPGNYLFSAIDGHGFLRIVVVHLTFKELRSGKVVVELGQIMAQLANMRRMMGERRLIVGDFNHTPDTHWKSSDPVPSTKGGKAYDHLMMDGVGQIHTSVMRPNWQAGANVSDHAMMGFTVTWT